MEQTALQSLSDLTETAHARLQSEYADINPMVSLRSGMREVGIPADMINVDCMRTRRRILLILHDDYPDSLLYQFTDLDQEAGNDFQQMALDEVGVDTLFAWMRDYFARA
jgi:hypothetical protein